MKTRFLAVLIFAAFFLVACDSPEHKSCNHRGDIRYSSEHGTFYCKKVNGRLQWER